MRTVASLFACAPLRCFGVPSDDVFPATLTRKKRVGNAITLVHIAVSKVNSAFEEPENFTHQDIEQHVLFR